MATTVYNTEEIELQDETTVILRPLPLKQLRNAMAALTDWQKVINKGSGVSEDDETFDVAKAGKWQTDVVAALIKIAAVCLQKQRPDLLQDAAYEDVLDVESSYRIIEVCMGIKLNDDDSSPKASQTALAGMI